MELIAYQFDTKKRREKEVEKFSDIVHSFFSNFPILLCQGTAGRREGRFEMSLSVNLTFLRETTKYYQSFEQLSCC